MDELKVQVLFFAKAREIVGQNSTHLSIKKTSSKLTGKQLLELLLENFPSLKDISQNIVLAVNQEYLVPDSQSFVELSSNSEIAVIPPLSGG